MDVFVFREKLVSEYERFSRNFTRIRAEDILQAVNEAYEGGRFWPAPLINTGVETVDPWRVEPR